LRCSILREHNSMEVALVGGGGAPPPPPPDPPDGGGCGGGSETARTSLDGNLDTLKTVVDAVEAQSVIAQQAATDAKEALERARAAADAAAAAVEEEPAPEQFSTTGTSEIMDINAKKFGALRLQGSFIFKLDVSTGTNEWFRVGEAYTSALTGDDKVAFNTATGASQYTSRGVGTTIKITSNLDDQEDYKTVSYTVLGPPSALWRPWRWRERVEKEGNTPEQPEQEESRAVAALQRSPSSG